MGKKTWASSEQLEWLTSQLPGFTKAQETRTTATFLSTVYSEFHEQWPISPPTPEEIAAAEEGEQQAISIKMKTLESVSRQFENCYLINDIFGSESRIGSITTLVPPAQGLALELF